MRIYYALARRGLRGLVGAAIAALALFGYTFSSSVAEDATTLTIASQTPPQDFNPSFGTNGGLGFYITLAYDSLIDQAADGTLEPGLATSWGYADAENKVFKLTLRDGVKFSNGEDVTAQAVADSINYFAKGRNAVASYLAGVTAAATGALEVTLTAENPVPDFPSLFTPHNLAGAIIAPAGIADTDKLATDSFGAGPYILDGAQSIAGDTYVYDKNPDYWNADAQHYDTVMVKVIQDENAAVAALTSHQVDVFMGGSPQTEQAAKNAGLTVIANMANWQGLLLYGLDGSIVPALKDVRVRQALNYAIDRQAIANAVYGGLAEPRVQPAIGPGIVGFDSSLESAYTFDQDKAKQLLTEAGFANGFDLPVAVIGFPPFSTLMDAIGGYLGMVGVNLKVNAAPQFGALFPLMYGGKTSATNIPMSAATVWQTYGTIWSPGGGVNGTHTFYPELHGLVQQAAAENTASAWTSVLKWEVDNAYTVPVVATEQLYYAAPTVNLPEAGIYGNIDFTEVTPVGGAQ